MSALRSRTHASFLPGRPSDWCDEPYEKNGRVHLSTTYQPSKAKAIKAGTELTGDTATDRLRALHAERAEGGLPVPERFVPIPEPRKIAGTTEAAPEAKPDRVPAKVPYRETERGKLMQQIRDRRHHLSRCVRPSSIARNEVKLAALIAKLAKMEALS